MICTVVGARPNFMKMAPVILELERRRLPQLFVHTGQHYDREMSDVFADELGMPAPDECLAVGSGTHAETTARVMTAFEQVCRTHRPRLVVVGGDVDSTLGAALAAAKLAVPVAHVEAGLRSFDRSMPEEINRVLTDHLSDLLFTTEPSGGDHLQREGIDATRIHFVGNCMIDSLRAHLSRALARQAWRHFGLEPRAYALVTLHRPGAVDDGQTLEELRQTVREVATTIPVLFPVHPRTRARIGEAIGGWHPAQLVEPLGYLDFLGLMARARVVLTDSGGIQEETTALGVPCLTLRPNTERPITVTAGTNRVCGTRGDDIVRAAQEILSAPWPHHHTPPLWDGHAAGRIVDVIERWLATDRAETRRVHKLPQSAAALS